jgi:hypothetical protein
MRAYKAITFGEGISCTLAEFKKSFAPLLIRLSDKEVREAHKAATKGNGKLSNSATKSEKTNASKD